MKKILSVSAVLCLVALLVFVSQVQVSEAACNPTSLSPCLAAIQSGSKPSNQCCSALKGQKSCICQYSRDPNIRKYINSPNARKVAGACGVPIPRC